MDEDRQSTFGPDGDLETDRPPEATGRNDFGAEKGPDETDGGFDRYAVSSLLQKAVRRSDEEVAAWAAWELARSGFGWQLWDRLNTFVVEDLRAGPVVGTVGRLESLADGWDHDSRRGQFCAVQAALATARARSTREAAHAVDYFDAVAEERAAARERGEDPTYDFPVDDLDPDGPYAVAHDGHTAAGTRRGRDSHFFRVYAGRVGPEGEDEVSAAWKRRRMALDGNDYTPAEREHALTPVDPGRRWDEPIGDL